MKTTMRLALITLLAAGFLAACQKPPQELIDGSNQALSAAESADAATYASAELEAAQAARRAADEELAVQNDKLGLFRSYEDAQKLLTEAKTKADAARDAAVAGKDKAKGEAEAALTAVQAMLDQASELLTTLGQCPRKPKGFAADLEMLGGRLDGLKAQTEGIATAIAGEQYFNAKTSAEELQGQVDPLLVDLQSAKEKIRC